MKLVNKKTNVIKDIPSHLVADYLGTGEWEKHTEVKEKTIPKKDKKE